MRTSQRACGLLVGLVCACVWGPARAQDKAIGVAPVRAGTMKGQSWALLIGVDQYLNVPQLRYGGADARLLGKILIEQCGFEAQRVLVMTDAHKDAALLPIRANLLNKIPNWLKLARPDDRVVVFFSGHGFLDDKGHMYLAPLDCDRDNLPLTAVPVAHLRDYLSNCKARVKVLVLDTCHAGAAKGDKAIGVDAAQLGQALRNAEGLVTLASCKADQVSHEWPDKGHGAFTYWLAQGLGGQADRTVQGNRDGMVTLDELYAFTYDRVTTWSARTHGKPQTPRRLSAEGVSGILALARVPLEGAERPSTRPTSGPRTLIVPDTYATIQSAIDAARAGDTVMVKPGIYREAITFKSGIRLLGTERGACRIEPAKDAMGMLVAMDCDTGSIEDLTFDGRRTSPTHVFRIGMQLETRDGATWIKEVLAGSPAQRAGLRAGTRIVAIQGKPIGESILRVQLLTGVLSGRANEVTVAVEGQQPVKLRAEKEAVAKTARFGLVLLDSRVGVHNCAVRDLDGPGIVVSGARCRPTLKRNRCHANAYAGIVFDHGAGGTAQGNTCESNKKSGIAVMGNGTAPQLKDNQCRKNWDGIVFQGGASGLAKGNTCENNQQVGISVCDAGSAPILKSNQCRANTLQGICYKRGAGGVAEGNVCERNQQSGIALFDTGTAPTLRKNTCRANTKAGIAFQSGAGGLAEGNTCDDNSESGITAFNEGTAPVLRANRCNRNGTWGISYWQGARPHIAADNTAVGNKKGQIMR